MVKDHLIEAIRTHNPTAPVRWLTSFDSPALRTYLDHLLSSLEPRGSSWIRPGDTPAVVKRRAAA